MKSQLTIALEALESLEDSVSNNDYTNVEETLFYIHSLVSEAREIHEGESDKYENALDTHFGSIDLNFLNIYTGK